MRVQSRIRLSEEFIDRFYARIDEIRSGRVVENHAAAEFRAVISSATPDKDLSASRLSIDVALRGLSGHSVMYIPFRGGAVKLQGCDRNSR